MDCWFSQAISRTAALICVELASDDILIDIIRWVLSIQDTAVVNVMLRPTHRSYLHVWIFFKSQTRCK